MATEVVLPVVYDKVRIDCGYRLDILVEGAVIVEVKSIDPLRAHPHRPGADVSEAH